jgi:hypothetical protein
VRCTCPLSGVKRTSSGETVPLSHLIGSGTVAWALGHCKTTAIPSRPVALGDLDAEHVFKVIHDFAGALRAALINAAVKHRFCQSKLPFMAGAAPGRRHNKVTELCCYLNLYGQSGPSGSRLTHGRCSRIASGSKQSCAPKEIQFIYYNCSALNGLSGPHPRCPLMTQSDTSYGKPE